MAKYILYETSIGGWYAGISENMEMYLIYVQIKTVQRNQKKNKQLK